MGAYPPFVMTNLAFSLSKFDFFFLFEFLFQVLVAPPFKPLASIFLSEFLWRRRNDVDLIEVNFISSISTWRLFAP